MSGSTREQAGVAMQPVMAGADHGQSDEDLARADLYGLLAELFGSPPTDHFFNRLAASPKSSDDEPDTPLTQAWHQMVKRAAEMQPAVVREEFNALFLAVGKPEVVSNASFYLAGSLNQQPLVDIRHALADLGIERDPGTSETEDHFAALCEVMRFLVAGELDGDGPPMDLLSTQRTFFSQHLSPWAGDFFDAIERHRSADLYKAVAGFARAFFEVEQQAFDIYAASQPQD
jgi:TorA maturation chaperone TorD